MMLTQTPQTPKADDRMAIFGVAAFLGVIALVLAAT